MTGEVEDTDVGFPGPDHHIAEREMPMKIAMGLLAVGAVIAGFLQIPWVTHAIDNFFEPTFAGSHYFHDLKPSGTLTAVGLIIGTILSLSGIWLAHVIWVQRPGTAARVRERLAPLYGLFVDGALTGGATGVVRAGSAAVRAVQTGFLRSYAAFIVIGMVAVTVYFLVQT
jgi:NADH-quinone oxidoreductase subunit L